MVPSEPLKDLDISEMRRIAKQLESDNPRWIVMFGVYSREFVAFARFDAPGGAIITARYPAALPDRMREAERNAEILQSVVPRPVTGAVVMTTRGDVPTAPG
jgi:hypothetical protein